MNNTAIVDAARQGFASGLETAAVESMLIMEWPELARPEMDRILSVARISGQPGACPPRTTASDKRQEVSRPPEAEVDPLSKLVTFRTRQLEETPPRVWFVDGMVTVGFNLLSAKKAMGKSFLLLQMAQAIATGTPFLGRATTKATVLYVSFELDATDLHERFRMMPPLSNNVFLAHTWPGDKKGLSEAERAIQFMDIGVVIYDTFLPMLPAGGAFDTNSYSDSALYLDWRLMAKRNGAAVIGSWHEGKTPREDYMLAAIGSTGLTAQADCIISIDRKRGDTDGKLFVGGNHAPDSAIPFHFENGMFVVSGGEEAAEYLTPTEKATMAALTAHPEGMKTAAVALALGRTESAARGVLNRLEARGKVSTVARGYWAISTLSMESVQKRSNDELNANAIVQKRSSPYRGRTRTLNGEECEREGTE